MSKRIIDLGDITGGVASSMHLAVDTQANTGAATIAQCFGSMINQQTPAKDGGSCFNINLDGELVLDPSINIPVTNSTLGGAVNLWLSNGAQEPEHVVTLDTFIDSGNIHGRGFNNQYFRVHSKTSSGQDIVLFGIDRTTGNVFKGTGPGSKAMVPLIDPNLEVNIDWGPYEECSSGTRTGAECVYDEIEALKKRTLALENAITNISQLVHVAQTPINNPVKGKLWWDTDTATLYVFDGAAWVQANIGAGYPGSDTSTTPTTP